MNDFNEHDLDAELTAMFEQRLEHNRQTIDAGPIQRDIAEQTRRRFAGWVMPSLLAAGATAAVLIAVVMSRGDTSTTVEFPPVTTPESPATSEVPTAPEATVAETVPEMTTPPASEPTVPDSSEAPEIVVGQGRVGDLQLPATEAEIAIAFPESQGWSLVPGTPTGIQRPDQQAGTGLGVFFGDELYFVYPIESDGLAQSARAFSEHVTTSNGHAVGQTLREISAARGRLLISLYEFVGEYVGYAGVDPTVSLFATAADGDVGDYGGGLSTESWNPDAALSVIDVQSVEWATVPVPPVDVLFYPTECVEDDTPTYDETIVPDLDFDGQRERWIARTCDAGAGQVVEYFLVNSGVERQTNFMGEGTLRIESADGTLFVFSLEYAEDDPLCCPSLRTETHYTWDGLGLVEVFAETGPALAQIEFATIAAERESAAPVIERVSAILGDPTSDTTVAEGGYCMNERRVSWGDLTLVFADSQDGTWNGFQGATYRGPVDGLNQPVGIGETKAALEARFGDQLVTENVDVEVFGQWDRLTVGEQDLIVFYASETLRVRTVALGYNCGEF